MGYHVEYGCTGQGSVGLGGTYNITEGAAGLVTVASLASVDGYTPFRRLHRQAWYGVGITPGGGPFTGIPLITWWDFMRIENETHLLNAFANILGDTLYWDVRPGGEIFLEVDWT